MAMKTEPFLLNIGPQHPSTHGVFRMRTLLDGEVIVDMEPAFGYLHRGIEKLFESRTYTQIVPLTDRCDYISSMMNNLAYVQTIEKLGKIAVPERAEYIRVIVAELMRISSHLVAIGSFLNDLGALATVFMYTFREREKIMDLFDMLCGQRMTYNYLRVGGVSQDVPPEFVPAVKKFVQEMPRFIDEYDELISENEIFLVRTKGVGILPKDLAISSSLSGPVLRASGVQWDLRRANPYSIYDRFKFDVPIGQAGDTFDRYKVRLEEMRQSVRILVQAIEEIPAGPVQAPVTQWLHLPKGDTYSCIESPKGELGFYVVSDGSVAPYRLHMRAPTFINLTAIREMVRGWKIADAIIIFGSIDICLGEVDR